jgi:uncharacterized membrane protein
MHPPTLGFSRFLAAFLDAGTGSVLGALGPFYLRLAELLRNWAADFNIPWLKYYALWLEAHLRRAGTHFTSEYLVWLLLAAAGVAAIFAVAALWRLLGSGIRIHKASFKKVAAETAVTAASVRAAVRGYVQATVDLLVEGLVVMCAAVVVTVLIYLWAKLAWYSYMNTPVGRLYPIYFPDRAVIMNAVLGQDLFVFPMVLTVFACTAGLFMGAVGRLFHITRYVYTPRGIMGRILVAALPLGAVTATLARAAFALPHWGAAFGAALLPALLVFPFCFKATDRLLPEIGVLFSRRSKGDRTPVQVVYLQDLVSKKRVLAFDPIKSRLTGRSYPAGDGIATQGMVLTRRGHGMLLYRYGRDLFFQVDDRELQLQPDMQARQVASGRFGRRFELLREESRLFRLTWSDLPLFEPRAATRAFFDAFSGILKDRTAFTEAFVARWDEEDEGGGRRFGLCAGVRW